MTPKTAILIGATGLTGSHLLKSLLTDERFGKVVVLTRRATGHSNPKLEEHIVDFNVPESWQELVAGDILFSAMGTTLKQAGGKPAQYRVDFTYQYEAAKAAAANKVPVYVLVSSVGANADSLIFYSKIKGELEKEVRKMPFVAIHILQPGPLEGQREKERPTEKTSLRMMRMLNAIGLMRGYRPVAGTVLARAMINAGLDSSPAIKVYRLLDVFRLAGVPLR
jgi:uncharacterized protein YbjT (DUF2867 family)